MDGGMNVREEREKIIVERKRRKGSTRRRGDGKNE